METPEFTDVDASIHQNPTNPLTENLNQSSVDIIHQQQKNDQQDEEEDVQTTRYTVIEDPDDPDMEIIYQSQNEDADGTEFSSSEINRIFSTQSSTTDAGPSTNKPASNTGN